MKTLIPVLEAHAFTDADMRGILSGLVNDGLNGPVPRLRRRGAGDDGHRQRRQLHVPARASLKSARNVNSGLDALQKTVANDERYSPAQFQAALRNFRGAVGL